MKLGNIVTIIKTKQTAKIIEISKISKKILTLSKTYKYESSWINYVEYKLDNGKQYSLDELNFEKALTRDNLLENILNKKRV